MAEVALTRLTKVYDKTPVLVDASLSLASGEFLTLLGPSGCGKTTLLRIVAGLVEPNSGTVEMDGRDVTRCRSIGARSAWCSRRMRCFRT